MTRALVIAATLLAALPQSPARDASRADASATLRGVVVDTQTGAPVRRARVVASRDGASDIVAASDRAGRFVLRDLPPGRYALAASKEGYLTTSYGQVQPGAPGLPVEVPGEVTSGDVTLTMARGAVIPGRVVDERGDPVPYVQVRALQLTYEDGARKLVRAGAQGADRLTDDLGGFRLYGLLPGRYYVAASASALRSPGSGAPTPLQVEARVNGTTYFPNAPDAGSAQPIVVDAGSEAGPITVVLNTGSPFSIRGHVVRASGEPFDGAVDIVASEGGELSSRISRSVRFDGSFEIPGVAPGSYHLTARDRRVTAVATADMGYAFVTVGSGDVDGVSIVAGKPGVVRGRVISDDGSPLVERASRMSVSSVNAGGPEQVWRASGSASVNEDLSFELRGLVGIHRFRVDTADTSDWSLTRALHGDRDVTDTGVSIGVNDVVDGITLVVSRAHNELRGNVLDANGVATSSAWVILFPGDPSLWKWPRWVRVTQPDGRGEYRVHSMPEYDGYLIAAVPYAQIDGGELTNPQTLARLRSQATPLALDAAEKKVVNVRLGAR